MIRTITIMLILLFLNDVYIKKRKLELFIDSENIVCTKEVLGWPRLIIVNFYNL